MLRKANRLPKKEIPLILRGGTHRRNELIEFVYRKTTGTPRFAFIVSTKIDKRAVSRNRMRRVMSESVRHILTMMQPVDGIFIVKNNFADSPQAVVEKMIAQLLTSVRLLNYESGIMNYE